MTLKKPQKSLKSGANRDGVLSLVNPVVKLEKDTYQRRLLKHLVIKSTQLLLKRNEKILQRVNSILNNLNV